MYKVINAISKDSFVYLFQIVLIRRIFLVYYFVQFDFKKLIYNKFDTILFLIKWADIL